MRPKSFCSFLLIIFLYGMGCSHNKTKIKDKVQQPKEGLTYLKTLKGKSLNLDGKQLAQIYCSSCHLYPEPTLLDKETWKKKVLPQMGMRLGMPLQGFAAPYANMSVEEIIKVADAGVFSSKPLLSEDNWEKIVSYYINEAPEATLPQQSKAEVEMGIPDF